MKNEGISISLRRRNILLCVCRPGKNSRITGIAKEMMPLEYKHGNQKRTYSTGKISHRVGQGSGVRQFNRETVSPSIRQRENP